MKKKSASQSAPARRSPWLAVVLKRRRLGEGGFLNLRVLIGLFMFAAGVLLALFATANPSGPGSGGFSNASAQGNLGHERVGSMIVIHPYHSDVSLPLREQPLVWPPKEMGEPHEANPNPRIPHQHVDAPDPVIQSSFIEHLLSQPSIPGPTLTWGGIPYPGVSCTCYPPDTNGEVGKTQYVAIVNSAVQVFDKTTGASLWGPNSISSLWRHFGGACEFHGVGDPVALYDQLADRWIITQFAFPTGGGTDECVAVSTTGDATGSWNRYGYHLGSDHFDYPKLSVWPDAYYMSMNLFNGTGYLGPQAFAFDRSKMLAGDPSATIQTPGITGGPTEMHFLPADVDGIIPPPPGAANPFIEWPSGSPLVYKIYKYHVDFVNPANSTFMLFATPSAAGFTELCPTTLNCVPQLGVASRLDGIGFLLMFRNAYRNINGGTLVNNFTVDANSVAGIRWFELRDVNTGPVTAPFQESTYQPDTTWRWMGSVAMDNQGNMALGFSASDDTIHPQIRYAGRLVTDPLNVLAQGEAHLFDGTGSQTDAQNRWGDYSDMTIDPVDDCTFYYTTEYYETTTAFMWRTRIGYFKFAECTTALEGTAHFTVTICDSGAPLANASVSIDGNLYGATLADGTYDAVLPPGNHTYAVSKSGFETATGNFDISNGTTTDIPVCLQGGATPTPRPTPTPRARPTPVPRPTSRH